MIIKNFKDLVTDNRKKLALSILETGFKAAMPDLALKKIVKRNYLQVNGNRIFLKNYSGIYVVAIGKASDLMTKTVNLLTKIDGGIVIIPQNTSSLVKSVKYKILRGGHPIPTGKSVKAAKATRDFLAKLQKTDLVIFLISGGASSMLSLPDGISLREKQVVTDLLLRSGADIHEINCIRKHLSQVKGGRLIESLRCKAIALVISDVIGDDLSTIGSGLTFCDKTTFHDAKNILAKYNLKNKIPENAWNRIDLGSKGLIPETPKKPKIRNHVILSNKNCLDAMAKHAKKLGFSTRVVPSISGNVKNAASRLSKLRPTRPQTCLIFGGETTVRVQGRGKGGRNQELVLHLLKRMSMQKKRFIVASAGTDGIDGGTSAAGAISSSDMLSGEIKKYLSRNDSYSYFTKYGGLIFTGPTHTNLMDIGLLLQG